MELRITNRISCGNDYRERLVSPATPNDLAQSLRETNTLNPICVSSGGHQRHFALRADDAARYTANSPQMPRCLCANVRADVEEAFSLFADC